jgi:hypothetical protein
MLLQGVHLDPSIYLMDEHNGTDAEFQKEASSASVEATASQTKRKSSSLEHEAAERARSLGSSELGNSHALKALVDDGSGNFLREKTIVGPNEQKELKTAGVSESYSVRPQAEAVNGERSSNGGELQPPGLHTCSLFILAHVDLYILFGI